MFNYSVALALARQRYQADTAPAIILDPWAAFLAGQEGNITSQGGEDGLIAALFARIGTRNRWCFEVGALDGLQLSNTWALRQTGWQAILIEANGPAFAALARRFAGWSILIHERITPDSLDQILAHSQGPADIDLGVIDIDGEDLPVWQGLTRFRPRVLLIEYNAGGDGILGGVGVWQAGEASVRAHARAVGYRPLVRTPCNLLLADETCLTPDP